jgi:predicted nucleic acid-binding protein
MSYVVDTDVLSTTSPTAPSAIPGLPAWLERNSEHLYLSVVSLMEISYGIAWLRHRQARRKAALLQAWLADVAAFHKSRVLMADDGIALRAGQLLATARAAGVEVGAEDALIAATADLRAMTVLTVNARHFAPMSVRYVDPRAGLRPSHNLRSRRSRRRSAGSRRRGREIGESRRPRGCAGGGARSGARARSCPAAARSRPRCPQAGPPPRSSG